MEVVTVFTAIMLTGMRSEPLTQDGETDTHYIAYAELQGTCEAPGCPNDKELRERIVMMARI